MLLVGRVWRSAGVRSAGTATLVAVTGAALLLAAPGAGAVDPSPSATASATASASSSATASPSPSATASPSPSASVTPTATPTPTPTPTATPASSADTPSAPAAPVVALPKELGSWCLAMFPPLRPGVERNRAQDLMNGKVNLNNGGTYTLTEHPNWRPQATSDTSGDRHVNSLNWALPLLYRGVHKQIPSMVDRFRQILTYWIEDHKGARSYWVNASIYGGLRTQTLVCAAQTLNDPVIAEAAASDATRMVSRYQVAPVVAIGANNTDLIRQTGAFAEACWRGDIERRDRAWANLVGVANGIIHKDGSDVEGSPGYATYIENLLRDVERTATTCQLISENIAALRGSLYDFVSQSMRPDFKLASIGDTLNEPLSKSFGAGDPRVEWVRSGGTSGTPPTQIYSNYDGGYTFGRSGWQPQPGGFDTFYSLRSSSTRPATPHAHDDGGSLTIYSRGVDWIGDPGPYRYENSSPLRAFVKSRNAHSSFTVSNIARNKYAGVRRTTSGSTWQTGGNDNTCVRDSTWGTVQVTRCVSYIRSVDAIVVVDYVNAGNRGKGKARRVVTERWQLPPGLTAENVNDVFTIASGNKRMDVYKAGEGGWKVTTAGPTSSQGWFTGSWGVKVPGAVLLRALELPKTGGTAQMVTVFVPRTEAESVPVVIDASGVTITRNGRTVTTPLPAP